MTAVFRQCCMRFEADPTSHPTAGLSRKVSWIRASAFKDIEGHEVDDNFDSRESNQLIRHGPHADKDAAGTTTDAAFLELYVVDSYTNLSDPSEPPLGVAHWPPDPKSLAPWGFNVGQASYLTPPDRPPPTTPAHELGHTFGMEHIAWSTDGRKHLMLGGGAGLVDRDLLDYNACWTAQNVTPPPAEGLPAQRSERKVWVSRNHAD